MFGMSECCLPDEPMMDVGDIRTILDDCDFEFSHAYPYCALKEASTQPNMCWQYNAASNVSANVQMPTMASDRACSAFHAADTTYFQLTSTIQNDRNSAFYPYPSRSTATLTQTAVPAYAQSTKLPPPVTYGNLVSTAVEQIFKHPPELQQANAHGESHETFVSHPAELAHFAVQDSRALQSASSVDRCQYSPVTPIDTQKPRLEQHEQSGSVSLQSLVSLVDDKPQSVTLKDTIRERVQSRMRALGKPLMVDDQRPKFPEKVTQQSMQKRMMRRERNKVAARRTRARRKELEEGLNEEKRKLLRIVNKRKELLTKLSNEFRQLRQLTISHLASETHACTNRQELLKFLHSAYESQSDGEAEGEAACGDV